MKCPQCNSVLVMGEKTKMVMRAVFWEGLATCSGGTEATFGSGYFYD